MQTHGKSLFLVLAAPIFSLLVGCAGSPVKLSSKQVNESVMKHSLAKDGSLTNEFKTRYARLTPGMTRKNAFGTIGIPDDASQVRLGVEDVRRILYGETKVSTFDEAEKLRLHTEKLCGTTIPLESSKKSGYLASVTFVGTAHAGYRVWLDLIYTCKDETLTFAQWRGSERLEDNELSAIWLMFSAVKDIR